jgi:hypothetical protein
MRIRSSLSPSSSGEERVRLVILSNGKFQVNFARGSNGGRVKRDRERRKKRAKAYGRCRVLFQIPCGDCETKSGVHADLPRSRTSYVIMMNGGSISWKFVKWRSVSLCRDSKQTKNCVKGLRCKLCVYTSL